MSWKNPVETQQVIDHPHGARKCYKHDIRSPILLVILKAKNRGCQLEELLATSRGQKRRQMLT
jgi:hypothetical protein